MQYVTKTTQVFIVKILKIGTVLSVMKNVKYKLIATVKMVAEDVDGRIKMLEKLGGIFLLIVSVVIVVIMGNDILYNTGLIQLAIYTMGVLGLGGAVYTLLKI